MGIAGSTYNNTTYNAFPFVNPNDGYMMLIGNPSQSFGGNVFLGTSGTGFGGSAKGDIVFVQGQNLTEVATQAMTTNSINAWEQFSLSYTPTANGEAVLLWDMYYENGAKSFWLDDLTVQ